MNRILLLLLFVLACVCYGKAQMSIVLSDKIALQESQIFKNKSAFNENQSSAETDFIYQRMEWEIDPEIRYISGKITTYFKSQIPVLNEVYFDLSDTLQVDSVIQNNQNIEFKHKEELVTIPLVTELSEN